MKNNRLFGIIYLLLSSKSMTAKDLAEYFEVSPRTIYRDIESLSNLNIPIYMTKGKNGGIHLLENYKLDKTLLSQEEQNEILFSLEGINKLQISSPNTYEKMRHLFSKNDENWFEIDFSVWDKSDHHKKTFAKIKNAIITKSIITFSYFSSYGTNTKRRVEPLKLYFKYNSWYLLSFDCTKNDYRFFKIMRIKDLNVTSETFERAFNYKEEKIDKPPKMIKLLLEINSKLAYRVYDEFEDTSISKNEDGNFLVTVTLPENEWIYGYILSFGENIKVLAPTHIKDEILRRLEKSLKNYL